MSTTIADPVTRAPSLLGQMRQGLDALAAGQWWQVGEPELLQVLALVGRVRHELARVEAHATGQAIARGLPKDRGMGAVDFLTQAQSQEAPAPPPGHAAMMDRLGRALHDQDEPLRETLAGFEAGLINPTRAGAIVRFHHDVAAHSEPEPLSETMATINGGALDRVEEPAETDPGEYDPLARQDRNQGPVRRRGWSDRELGVVLRHAKRVIKPAKEQEDDERRDRSFRTLYALPAGESMTEYRLTVEPEAAAVIEAALTALSTPQKDEDGNPDPRSAPQRRADAVVEAIQRGVSAPEGVPQSTKAQVMVVIPLSDLYSATQGAGVTMTGQVLSPATVRRMACDAGIIPVVLGTEGEILDMGREKRLFTPAQHRALWHRDKRCTFPGCTIPPQWCAAHHIQHWVDGGPTDLDNAALLCQRHHTYVHTNQLTATLTPTGVHWHTWHS
ncbi:MAG TPA: DUF222 domain-containing protein [Beutenbergiaceae bacterium]|nr:DUF222 domain-containing protein [Beutenbergiaceae bacterium]